MPAVNVNIQPAIINWAISQTDEGELGVKLMNNIKQWLDGTKTPTFNQIENFSKKQIYHLAISFYRHHLLKKLNCWNVEQLIALN